MDPSKFVDFRNATIKFDMPADTPDDAIITIPCIDGSKVYRTFGELRRMSDEYKEEQRVNNKLKLKQVIMNKKKLRT